MLICLLRLGLEQSIKKQNAKTCKFFATKRCLINNFPPGETTRSEVSVLSQVIVYLLHCVWHGKLLLTHTQQDAGNEVTAWTDE